VHVPRTYLVECYCPDVTEAGLVQRAARVDAAAREPGARGRCVEFLGGLLIPGDEVSFWRFAGDSRQEVQAASARAGLVVARVRESIEYDRSKSP
jgi:hypothetical protein